MVLVQAEGKNKNIVVDSIISPVINGKVIVRVTHRGRKRVSINKIIARVDVIDESDIMQQDQVESAAINSIQTANEEIESEDSKDKLLIEAIDKKIAETNLPADQQQKLREVLMANRNAFGTTPFPSPANFTLPPIINTNNAPPIYNRPRYRGHIEQKTIDENVEMLLRYGIIRTSEGRWSSAILLIQKKDKSIRFALDYRGLNAITTPIKFPLPTPNELYQQVRDTTYFSALDMLSGFHQFELDEHDKPKTGFHVRGRMAGAYEFNRMPFGIINAPEAHQRAVECMFKDMLYKNLLVYIDDMLIYSQTFDDHIQHITQTLQLAIQYNIHFKLSKCTFASKSIKYLGFIVSGKGLAIDPDVISAVKNIQAPKNKQQLRSLMGFFNYYRRFITSYSKTTACLAKLLRKTNEFIWTDKHEHAFTTTINSLINAPILSHANPNITYLLHTDASCNAVGSVLSQMLNGTEQPIAFYSRLLTDPELKLHINDAELLAIADSAEHFHDYLYGSQVHIYTDSSSAVSFYNSKDILGKKGRWIAKLQALDATIQWKQGASNPVADCMSRNVYPKEEIQQEVTTTSTLVTVTTSVTRTTMYWH